MSKKVRFDTQVQEQQEQPRQFQNTKKVKKQEKAQTKAKVSEEDTAFLDHLKRDLIFLIRKCNSPEQKHQKAAQMYNSLASKVFKVGLSKVGGRSIQMCLKYGDQSVREQLLEKLFSSESHFTDLLKSKLSLSYGHYIGITIVRIIPNQFKKRYFDILFKHLNQFVAHPTAAQVLNRFILKNATPAQVNQFRQAITEHGKQVPEFIENAASKIIEKGMHSYLLSLHILNIALPVLIPAEIEKIITYFSELEVVDYLYCKEGAIFFCSLINICENKTRKIIMKQIANQLYLFWEANQQFFYVALLKLLHSLDDTKTVGNGLLKKLCDEGLGQVLNTKEGYAVISSLFLPKHNELTQFDNKASTQNQFSKKEEETRLQELSIQILGPVLDVLDQYQITSLFREVSLSRFIGGVLRIIVKENVEEGRTFLDKITNSILEDETQGTFDSDPQTCWLLSQPDAQRLAKSIIFLSCEESIFKDNLNDYNLKLKTALLKRVSDTLSSKAVFLLVALIEQTPLKTQILNELKKMKLQWQQYSKNSGVKILQQLL